ncbi:hypothetical protein E3N88_21340 [Mikania micrantha]|uniref:Uncharacterized protein n=1 Tax=Mikania micrantha TaxID=192012 RepID=A0A5N6NMC9_9ASTR|nr:hypothetical protein E3N88_21340 [Mikania micrantha]
MTEEKAEGLATFNIRVYRLSFACVVAQFSSSSFGILLQFSPNDCCVRKEEPFPLPFLRQRTYATPAPQTICCYHYIRPKSPLIKSYYLRPLKGLSLCSDRSNYAGVRSREGNTGTTSGLALGSKGVNIKEQAVETLNLISQFCRISKKMVQLKLGQQPTGSDVLVNLINRLWMSRCWKPISLDGDGDFLAGDWVLEAVGRWLLGGS